MRLLFKEGLRSTEFTSVNGATELLIPFSKKSTELVGEEKLVCKSDWVNGYFVCYGFLVLQNFRSDPDTFSNFNWLLRHIRLIYLIYLIIPKWSEPLIRFAQPPKRFATELKKGAGKRWHLAKCSITISIEIKWRREADIEKTIEITARPLMNSLKQLLPLAAANLNLRRHTMQQTPTEFNSMQISILSCYPITYIASLYLCKTS